MNSARRAFTLLELLTVIVIVSMLIGLGVSSIRGVLGSYRLAVAADSLAGGLESARLLAAAGNKAVEFRLIRPSGGEWSCFQLYIDSDTNGKPAAHGGVFRLPEGIRLCDDAVHGGMLTLPRQTFDDGGRYAGADYAAIRFSPSGDVRAITGADATGPLGASNGFLTLVAATVSGADLPANWIALSLDAKTGAVARFQP